MVYKVAALIVGLGLVSCGLLATRQARAQAAHEMAEVQHRVAEHDRELWKLRAEIAKQITPDKVESIARKYGMFAPINAERYQTFVRLESEEATQTALVVPNAGSRR